MKIVQFNSVGGAAGDMILGSLIALGADIDTLNQQLATLIPEKFLIVAKQVSSYGMNGVSAQVIIADSPDDHHHEHCIAAEHQHEHSHHHHATAEHQHEHSHHHHAAAAHHHHQSDHHHSDHGHHQAHTHANQRNFTAIKELINAGRLSDRVKQQSIAVFSAIAEAEGKVHNMPPEQVHFHEVGAVDSIVDIVGCCLALEMLNIDAIAVSPLPLGCGTMRCQHGIYPIPAPATVELLKNLPVVQTDHPYELVTPTGAALLSTLPRHAPGAATVLASGNSFGQRQLNDRPNLLRAILYETASQANSQADECLLLESNIDDSTPEIIATLPDRLLHAGALDVWITPIQMKKQRPAIKLSLLCEAARQAELEEIIFRETTTFGIRYSNVSRHCLEREITDISTDYGSIPVKIGYLNGKRITVAPEIDACIKLAQEQHIAVRDIYDAAKKTT